MLNFLNQKFKLLMIFINKKNIKIIVSICLIVLILWQVNIAETFKIITSMKPAIILAVIIGYCFGQIVSAYKWFLILKASNIICSTKEAISSYFIGMFVNTFGLGIVGGDLTRALLVASKNKAKAIATVVADRGHGLAVLAALALCFSISSKNPSSDHNWLLFLIIVLAISVLGWIFGPAIALKILPKGKIRNIVEQISQAFPKNLKTIFNITLISICFHSLQIFLHWLMGIGIDKQIPISYLFLAIPIINISTSLPISWQGIGVREFAYIYFLSPLYLTKEECLAFGALWLIATTISGCFGGIVLWTNDKIKLPTKNKNQENA